MSGEGLVEVVGGTQAGGGGGPGLVQEAGFGEGGEGLAYLGEMGVFGVQGGGELGFDDGDTGCGEGVQRGVGIFEGGGEVAGVDADTDAVVADRGERGDGVVGRLDDAAGFRFQADADGAAGQLFEGVEAFGEGAQRGAGGQRALVVVRGAPGEGQGGDGPVGDVVREKPGEDAGQGGGVVEAFRVGPVRRVDAVLDLLGAEALIGEAVEGDDLEAAPVEFGAQAAQRRGVGDQGVGGVPGEPQTDTEPVAAEAAPYGFAVIAKLGEDTVEGLGGVDVGAVGEVDGGAVGVTEA